MTEKPAKSYRPSVYGLLATILGLVTLVVLPIMARFRSDTEYDRVSRIEMARGQINKALDAALRAQAFGFNAYFTLPGSDQEDLQRWREQYRTIHEEWTQATGDEEDIRLCGQEVLQPWKRGKTVLDAWFLQHA